MVGGPGWSQGTWNVYFHNHAARQELVLGGPCVRQIVVGWWWYNDDKKMKEDHLEECCIGIVDLAETPVFLWDDQEYWLYDNLVIIIQQGFGTEPAKRKFCNNFLIFVLLHLFDISRTCQDCRPCLCLAMLFRLCCHSDHNHLLNLGGEEEDGRMKKYPTQL